MYALARWEDWPETICGTLFYACGGGAWLGSWVVPLDWNESWQKWPIPGMWGAVGAYVLAAAGLVARLAAEARADRRRARGEAEAEAEAEAAMALERAAAAEKEAKESQQNESSAADADADADAAAAGDASEGEKDSKEVEKEGEGKEKKDQKPRFDVNEENWWMYM